jgi:hypothetical protein
MNISLGHRSTRLLELTTERVPGKSPKDNLTTTAPKAPTAMRTEGTAEPRSHQNPVAEPPPNLEQADEQIYEDR